MSLTPDNAVTPKSLRTDGAAALLGISKRTLRRWECDMKGFPKARRLNCRVTLYDRDELLAFRDRHTVEA